jgi:hypothetical protein
MKRARLYFLRFFLLIVFYLTSIAFSACQHVTQTVDEDYLTDLPKTLTVDNSTPQTYEVSLHWNNRDIDGVLINNNLVKALYTRGLEDGYVRWNDVQMKNLMDTLGVMRQIPELNGLLYKVDGDNFVKQEFYKNFPQQHVDLIRWFVQDGVAIETYGWMYFDSLKLNEVFYPAYFQNQRIDIENYVNFTNQSLSLRWTGVSKRNNETCAIIHYQAMYNNIDANTDVMKLSGRSLYWGDIWISLTDKQIEYATMYEDVVFKMTLKANNLEQRLDLQREIIFKKIN